MKEYKIMEMFADGYERKKTLCTLVREIEQDNPNAVVEIISVKKGRIWSGHAKYILADLRKDYVKQCVKDIEINKYGISIYMR